MAFINDDEIEGLHRKLCVVDDGQRLLDRRWVGLEEGTFLVLHVEIFLPLEDRIEAWDRRDTDLAGRVDGIAFQMLNDLFFGEFRVGVRAGELLKLVERLLAQVVAVHEEENPLRSRELEETLLGRGRPHPYYRPLI